MILLPHHKYYVTTVHMLQEMYRKHVIRKEQSQYIHGQFLENEFVLAFFYPLNLVLSKCNIRGLLYSIS